MLKTRVITASLLAPVVIAAIFLLPNFYLSLFILLIILLAAWEWARLSGFVTQAARVSYALLISMTAFLALHYVNDYWLYFSLFFAVIWWLIAFLLVMKFPKGKSLWSSSATRLLLGVIILLPMLFGLMYLKDINNPALSNQLLIWLMLLVWGGGQWRLFCR